MAQKQPGNYYHTVKVLDVCDVLALACKVCHHTLYHSFSSEERMKKVNVTVRLEKDAVEFLDTLGQSLDRDRSYLIKEAVQSYISLHRWQIEEITKAIAEADAGGVASEKEMQALFKKWSR
jgi:predicted transcriptional regulator